MLLELPFMAIYTLPQLMNDLGEHAHALRNDGDLCVYGERPWNGSDTEP